MLFKVILLISIFNILASCNNPLRVFGICFISFVVTNELFFIIFESSFFALCMINFNELGSKRASNCSFILFLSINDFDVPDFLTLSCDKIFSGKILFFCRFISFFDILSSIFKKEPPLRCALAFMLFVTSLVD